MLVFSIAAQPACAQQILPPLSIPALKETIRPLHLRALSYNGQAGDFRAGFDQGDSTKEDPLAEQKLLNYFFTGLILPNSVFWVNLKPGAEMNEVMDERLARTDLGRVLLEADVQLKKDVSRFTSPDYPEGKRYWDRFYKKAETIFGRVPQSLPAACRPWIVPDQVIIRVSGDETYIFKASLKIRLESEQLPAGGTAVDPRMKELNEFSASLMRELVIPRISRQVNTGSRYASLRQVVYSLILAQNLKNRLGGNQRWASLVDSGNLNGLVSTTPWSREEFFRQYERSLRGGEYQSRKQVQGISGSTVRRFTSGGVTFTTVGTGPAVTEIKGDPGFGIGAGLGLISKQVTGIALKADGGDWNLDESKTSHLFDREWYEKDIRAHSASIVTERYLPNDAFSVKNGFMHTNSRELNGLGRIIIEWVISRSDSPARVLDLGPGAGVEPSQIFLTARKMAREVLIDTVSLTPIAPSLLLLRDERAQLFSEVLEQPYLNTQYILPLIQAADKIKERYRVIYDNYGAFYYTAMEKGLIASLNLVLPLLDPEGILYVCGLYSTAEDQRFARVADDYIVIRVRKSDQIMAFRKDSSFARAALPWLSEVEMSSKNNIHEVISLMPLIDTMSDELFRRTLPSDTSRDGGKGLRGVLSGIMPQLSKPPALPDRAILEADIDAAERRQEIEYGPGSSRASFDDFGLSQGLMRENTRDVAPMGKMLFRGMLAAIPKLKLMVLGPGAGVETAGFRRMAEEARSEIILSTVSRSPLPPSLMITFDDQGRLVAGMREQPVIDKQFVGPIDTLTITAKSNLLYDNCGALYYLIKEIGLARALEIVLPWLEQDGILYVEDLYNPAHVPVYAPGEEFPELHMARLKQVQEMKSRTETGYHSGFLDGYVIVRSSDKEEKLIAVRKDSAFARRIQPLLKDVLTVSADGIHEVSSIRPYVEALNGGFSKDGGNARPDPGSLPHETGRVIQDVFGLGGDIRERPGFEVIEEKEFMEHDIMRVRVSGQAAAATEMLSTELMKHEGMRADTFDLMFDRERRLLAVFPIPSRRMELWYDAHLSQAQKSKFLNLSYYYHEIPQVSETGFREKWRAILAQLKDQRKIILSYKSTIERIPLYELNAESGGPFIFAEFDRQGGGYSVYRPILLHDGSNTLYSLLDQLPEADSAKHQIITAVLPTVYSPAANNSIDAGYYAALSNDSKGRQGQRALVVGPGAGLEAWMEGVRTDSTVYCAGINPFEVANVRLTALLGGFRVEAVQADNIIDEHGTPRFFGPSGEPLLFDRIRWNMPAVRTMETARKRPQELGRLQEKWDGDLNGDVLKRFARGLALLLKPGGAALAWNKPRERMQGTKFLDINQRLFETGGESEVDSQSPRLLRVQAVEHGINNERVKTYYISKPVDGGTTRDGGDRGGIDLTALAAPTQAGSGMEPGVEQAGFDPGKEWSGIERLVNAGMLPAQERIARLFRPEYIKGKARESLVMLARILVLHEITGTGTDPALIRCLESVEAESCRNY